MWPAEESSYLDERPPMGGFTGGCGCGCECICGCGCEWVGV